ncbi:MAG: class I tRNA ligase family protein, partial [Candidatus Diapherotrites archaeon]|nr:class I tRNA ligase family protein [Candidatus Diapherotrites archaeon]
ERYLRFNGKTAIAPLFGIEVPIKAHPFAKIDKGTGLVMMCSAGDTTDISFFREQGIKPIISISKEGTMNSNAGFLEGIKVKDARKKIIETLREKKLIVKETQIMHRTPICDRSNDEIEFIAMKEFYVKQVEFKDKMRELADKINFFAPASKQILLDWIDSVSIDWPISRRRYYATEVPLWYCKNEKCKHIIVPEKGKYYKPWNEPAPVKECPKCKGKEFVGDIRVFDTWFDSSISPLYILGYERFPEFFKKHPQCSLRPQGKEIVRTWLYYTVLKDFLLTGKVIFKDAWINYHIVDEKGIKMSKRLGNVIDPHKILEQFGAEPFRFWAAVEGNLDSTDFKCSNDRIQGAGKSLSKLWNVAKYVSMFPNPEKKPTLNALDEWILNELNELVKQANTQYENYDFHNPAISARHFIWETLASHYIELSKPRAYNQDGKFSKEEQDSAHYTLHECLKKLLEILAPIVPLMTGKIYKDLYSKDVHFEKFPTPGKESVSEFSYSELADLDSLIWKTKKDSGKNLRDTVAKLSLPGKFKTIEADLKAAHSIQELVYSDEIKIEL